jgi:protein PET100
MLRVLTLQSLVLNKHRAKNPHHDITDATVTGARSTRARHYMTKPRYGLEVFKFAVYLSVPIFLTVTFAANPTNLESIIRKHAYVVYPPEGPKPPSAAEMRKIVEANKKKKLGN